MVCARLWWIQVGEKSGGDTSLAGYDIRLGIDQLTDTLGQIWSSLFLILIFRSFVR